MNRLVEIRSYNLKPGSRDQYHRLMLEKALPLLQRWQVDVVAFGPSPHDEDTYYLIRSFADLADRERSEDAFYGSDDWRKGPRQEILALIDNYTTIVLELDEAVVQGFRR